MPQLDAPEKRLATQIARSIGYDKIYFEPAGCAWVLHVHALTDTKTDDAALGALIEAIDQDPRLVYLRYEERKTRGKKVVHAIFYRSHEKWDGLLDEAISPDLGTVIAVFPEVARAIRNVTASAQNFEHDASVASLLLQLAANKGNAAECKKIRRQLRQKGYRLSENR